MYAIVNVDSQSSVPGPRPLQVIVAGLAELGGAVVLKLLEHDFIRVHVFDPEPVRPADVGVLFGPIDIGATRGEVVNRRFVGTRRPVQLIGAESISVQMLEAGLRPWLERMDAVVNCVGQPGLLQSVTTSMCHAAGVPLVLAQVADYGGVVGPLSAGDQMDISLGCPACAELHRTDRGSFASDSVVRLTKQAGQSALLRQAHTCADLAVLADLALLTLCQAIEVSRGERRLESKAVNVNFVHRIVSVENVVKHHACTLCYPAPRSTQRSVLSDANAWLESLDSLPDAAPVDMAALHRKLQSVTGELYGLCRAPTLNSAEARQHVWRFFRSRAVNPKDNKLANAHVAVALRSAIRAGRCVTAASEGFDFFEPLMAKALSLIEGMERLFAVSFCDPNRIIQARYMEIASDAFDPRGFPLYADWQYAQPGFPLHRFDPEATTRWVSAVDLGAKRPVFVPFDLVYNDGSATAIYRTNSNGAACHTSPQRALINAIYEVVERDALMVAWLNQLSLPRIALGREDLDPWDLRATLDRLDLQLEHVEISTDIEIPVTLGVLRDRRNPDLFLVDMVACLNPHRRLNKLYRELGQFLYPYLVTQTHFINERTHDPHPDNVMSFADHAAFYQSATRNRLAGFLSASPIVRAFSQATSSSYFDPDDELGTLLQRLSSAGLQVLAVNCTVPLLQGLGLHAVKVLIPGLQQLNAEHRLRVLGGDRHAHWRRGIGPPGPKRDLANFNPWPHPFW